MLTENDVRNEEHHQRNVIIRPRETKVGRHALYLGIPNGSSVELGDEVQAREPGEKMEVDLFQELDFTVSVLLGH